MKILFLIGNGFDRNLDLPTRYKDFYDNYQLIKTHNDAILKLKQSISGDYETWSCLEKGLGVYTAKLKDKSELDDICYDLKKHLGLYLKMQENKVDFENIDLELLYDYFAFPENSLLPREQQRIKEFTKNWYQTAWHVNIITFNYTYTIEKMLGPEFKNRKINKHHNHQDIQLVNLYHIHGYYDDRMILGVNDEGQIANESLREDIDVIEELVKNECNKANNHMIETTCEARINAANLICIYGCSLGETDNRWWEIIGNRLKEDVRLIIFYKESDDLDPILSNRSARTARRIRQKFLNQTSLSSAEQKQVEEKVVVSINSKLFSSLIKTSKELAI